MDTKLEQAFKKYDDYNREDPHLFTWEHITYPQEYFFSLQLYLWTKKLSPSASEALLLASRSQHIGRWEIPREKYPANRVGYLSWRKELGIYHAQISTRIMKEIGYDTAQMTKVEQIILKRGLKDDPEVQIIENALCLVFLQFQYEDFHHKHEADKVIHILRKSLLKMDQDGHRHALTLSYSKEGLHYIQEALKFL